MIFKAKKAAYDKGYYVKNKARISTRGKVYRENNKDKIQLYIKSDKRKATARANRMKNKAIRAASEAKRRAAKVNCTPKWLTKEHLDQMKAFYVNCPPGWSVDHIVPLQGENVCGLHVPWNLQYLPVKLNSAKRNKLLKHNPIISVKLVREVDVSGVSGTGVVAHGAVMPSGKVVLEWNSEMPSVEVHENIGFVYKIHGHNGMTKLISQYD